MTAPSKTYRVYSFDIDLRAVNADLIDAASDEEVIAKARSAGFGSKCEIWDGKRLIAQLERDRRQA